ncbi:MAG: hypothetical protein PVJ52_03570 [Candidatus Woesebacteria bacterium]|jgi:hypothetical protein
MSKVFYDHLIGLEDLEREINSVFEGSEEKEELWQLVDEIIHHRVLGCVLDNLPHEHHEEFISNFHESPHDETHFEYLEQKTEGGIVKEIKISIKQIGDELVSLIEDLKKENDSGSGI